MSGRTYLSIGDVLTLLRREFPDVTISKIRFLESQGLVNPERTPSGYRKFYEHDVERLRWVLRQQREHFLPLKVIKGRLEEETTAGGDNGREVLSAEHDPEGRLGSSGAGSAVVGEWPAPVLVVQKTIGPEEVDDAQPPRSIAHGGGAITAKRRGHDEDSYGARTRDPQPQGQELPGFEDDETSANALNTVSPPRPAADAGFAPGRPRAALPEEPSSVWDPPEAGHPAEGDSPGDSAASASAGDEHPRRRSRGDTAKIDGELGSVAPVGAFSGTSMTIEELAAASGLDPAGVRQLESYGLIAGRAIGGVGYFDEDSLTVVTLAGAFAHFGVEARHLRLHLLAAQRESGFIEQIVLPLLKQRNPASRQRARETVAELSRLGQELRAEFLRKRLREQLGD
jgi:DNA-binding transcriptional MerR regulator